jgi:hypothetical protein
MGFHVLSIGWSVAPAEVVSFRAGTVHIVLDH